MEFKYNKMHMFSFRFQPFFSSDITKITNINYQKIFLSFRTRDNKFVCNPVITFVPKQYKVEELKILISRILSGIEFTKKFTTETKDLKLYTFKFEEDEIRKDSLLIESRDKVDLSSFFKNRVWNLLVEFPALQSNYKEGDLTIN